MTALPSWKHCRQWLPLALCVCATGSLFLPWIVPPMQQRPVRAEVGASHGAMHPRYIYDQDVAWSGWDILSDRRDDYARQIKRDLFPADHTLEWRPDQTFAPFCMFPAMILFLYAWHTPVRFLRESLSRVSIVGLMVSIIAIMSSGFTATIDFPVHPYSHTTFWYRSTLAYGAYGASFFLLCMLILRFESLDIGQPRRMPPTEPTD